MVQTLVLKVDLEKEKKMSYKLLFFLLNLKKKLFMLMSVIMSQIEESFSQNDLLILQKEHCH